ncbi:START domain-containing protein [Pseudomonas sp. Gutcm_11s]|uniref:START domain-containing protein n=1 Tax=Pseudomonas sp. Gutcm_11s TaxID=3026088 RepID=UPI00235EA2C0|nr:START domain-containing protein [Pseudomonas sp. Gutcm_11s]MDD0843681.1 START domain-containing protein [Pseudomonas sp. Gutcm_11s]
MIALSRVAAVCGLSLLASGLAHAEDWKLAKDEDGIKIYLSEVQGSKYKAYRGVTTIKSDVASLRALQEDVQGSCKWIHACAEQSLLKHEGAESWVYTRFEMPWPVTARDSVLHVVTVENADGSLVRKLDGQPEYRPADKDHVRVASLEGAWTFVPKADGMVEVTYQVHTEPGGSVPSWLANSFVVDAPFNTLNGLRALAEKR